ncbi:hypothetical protein JCM8547_006484 [Rhodosporidiobolus lusitaniae]
MLDRLPVELLSHIVALAAPVEYTVSYYFERRQFLYNVCLVSKRMRAVAQPMLVEVFEVFFEEHMQWLDEIDEKGRSRASGVKLLVLRGTSYDSFFLTKKVDVRRILERCSRVIEVRVLDAGEIVLDCCRLASSSLIVDHNLGGPYYYYSSSPSPFASLPPFLRYYHEYIDREFAAPEYLDKISSALRKLALTLTTADPDDPFPLRVLILPTYFKPYFADSDEMDELLPACRSSGVEIVWEEQHDWSCQSLVSPWFWRYRHEEIRRAAVSEHERSSDA